jgi:hypothetical protein
MMRRQSNMTEPKQSYTKSGMSPPLERFVYLSALFMITLTLFVVLASIFFGQSIWNTVFPTYENHCIWEGKTFDKGEMRPDGRCECLYGRTKQILIWYC